MGRVFILALISSFVDSNSGFAQNLLLNGSFEEVHDYSGNPKMYLDTFYAKDWFAPTDGSVDIYRDIEACDETHIKNIEPGMGFCVKVDNGSYCIGLYTITHYGYMEHITGQLKEPLVNNEVYRVSFSIKFYGDEPYFSKGFGYKFSKDSIVFKSKKKFNKRLNPFYSSLFMEHKVYSDFEFNEYLTDSTWNRYSTYYTAKGGEKFITFGQFAFKPDEKVVEQVEFIQRNPSMEKTNKFIKSGKSVFIKRIDSIVIDRKNYLSENYYLLDDVVVERVLDEITIQQKKTCRGCIDSDSMTTRIPNKRIIQIDKGFFGDLDFELVARLKPTEAFVIKLGNRDEIFIFPEQTNDIYQEIIFSFKYPANKVKGKNVIYSIEKISIQNRKEIESSYLKKNIQSNDFNWTLFTSIKNLKQ